jgi:hypothetical protein
MTLNNFEIIGLIAKTMALTIQSLSDHKIYDALALSPDCAYCLPFNYYNI